MARILFTGIAIAVGVMACSPDDPITPNKSAIPTHPRMAIVDQTNGGASAFRWLPPMAATSDFEGTNDGSAAPVVEICVFNVASCTVIATSGNNLPVPTVVTGKKGAGSNFTLTWKTQLFQLDPTKPYRVVVKIGGTQQGFADVDVVATPADLATVPSGFAGVAIGQELEINFRIVRGLTRTWQGGAAAKGKNADPAAMTSWANAANWTPAGVPFRLDTAVIPVTQNQPTLTAHDTVGRVVVSDGATLAIGAYNLSANAGASTAGAGRISATTGLLILSGAGTIAGTLPRFVVSGSYTLAADVSTPAVARIAGGRLLNSGWLLRVAP